VCAIGRPRHTCSRRCRHHRDRRVRKIRRRESWIGEWRAEEGAGTFVRSDIRSAIRRLRAELRALRTPAVPAAVTDGAAHPIAPAAA
jgi:hypothetical protein